MPDESKDSQLEVKNFSNLNHSSVLSSAVKIKPKTGNVIKK